MSRAITIALPFPPSVNTYWRMWKNRMLLSKAGRKYQTDCLATVLTTIGLMKPLRCRVEVEVVLHAPDNKRRDLDNFMKGLLDALHHCRLIEDDSLIDRLVVERGYVSKESPRAEVSVAPIDKNETLFQTEQAFEDGDDAMPEGLLHWFDKTEGGRP